MAGHRLEALYVLGLGTGVRQAEALGLRWRNVDRGAGTLSVRQTLQRVDHESMLVPPKTAKSRRDVAMPDCVVAALQDHREHQRAEGVHSSWDLVFTRPNGQPLHSKQVLDQLNDVLRAASLPTMTFHELRHAYASLAIGQGVTLEVIQELLGHTDYSTTRNIYAHLTEDLNATRRRPSARRSDCRPDAGGYSNGHSRRRKALATTLALLPVVRKSIDAPVAQWTERRTSNPKVGGSNPPGGTSFSNLAWLVGR